MIILSITRFTLHEAVSRRLILAGMVVSLAFVALFALGFAFVFGRLVESAPRSRQVVPIVSAVLTLLGLYAVNFLASFLALFLSVGSISGEIDAGTLHAVLARPIRRSELVVGRWLGYALLMAAYLALMVGLLLLVTRLIAGFEAPNPLPGIGLMLLGVLLLLSLSLFGSTLLPTLANGVVAFTLFALGWLAGMIEWVGTVLSNEAMLNLGTVVSLLVPSDALWRGASYYLQPGVLLAASSFPSASVPFFATSPPSAALVIWSTGYTLVLLLAAVRAFARRDV